MAALAAVFVARAIGARIHWHALHLTAAGCLVGDDAAAIATFGNRDAVARPASIANARNGASGARGRYRIARNFTGTCTRIERSVRDALHVASARARRATWNWIAGETALFAV